MFCCQVPLVLIDSIYYGKFVLAPLNILVYNVFGKGGPDLYGRSCYQLCVLMSDLWCRGGAMDVLLC